MLPRDGVHEDEWQVLDLLGSPATSVAASFDQLFKLYRGHRFSEELEALGNEASRSCNRVRTQLPGVFFLLNTFRFTAHVPLVWVPLYYIFF